MVKNKIRNKGSDSHTWILDDIVFATGGGLDVALAGNAFIADEWAMKPGRLSPLLLGDVSGVKGRGDKGKTSLFAARPAEES